MTMRSATLSLATAVVLTAAVLPAQTSPPVAPQGQTRSGGSSAQAVRPPSLDVRTARRALAAAIAVASEAKVRVSIAVVDANGDLVAFERMDGAVSPSVLISQGKAHAALLFGMSTADLQDAIAAGRPVTATISAPPPTPMVIFPSRGGAPIFKDGKIVAAVGVAGVGPAIEEVIAKAGADAAEREPSR